MNFWTPQTGKMGDGWAYTYGAHQVRGFKQTHQPSPWINDYGQFSLMPVRGEDKFDEESPSKRTPKDGGAAPRPKDMCTKRVRRRRGRQMRYILFSWPSDV